MNLAELDNFKLDDAVNFHQQLNPALYYEDKMRPPVRAKLMEVAQDFMTFLGVLDIALVDITVSGSNAAYSYTPYSDIDLHLIVDFNQLSNDEIFRELFDAKKYQYNEQHDIKVKGYDVEVYVQDVNQPHSSLGEYSINRDDWNKIPTMQRANLDEPATQMKHQKLEQVALRALAADDLEYLNNVLDVIKRYRRAGLNDGGEFGPENLAFKMLRRLGLFRKLWDKKRELEDRELSLESVDELAEIRKELLSDGDRKIYAKIKEMYRDKPDLFDRYTFDTVYKGATKLVEGVGRIVKGVNTTCDVGVDQLSIEARKLGFDVTRDGRPPLLTESYDVLLRELDMSPGYLRGKVGELVKSTMPIIGIEIECCFPNASADPNESDEDVGVYTTWEDIQNFFELNEKEDFQSLVQDYQEWVSEKSDEWVESRVLEIINNPGRENAEILIDMLVNNYYPHAEFLQAAEMEDDELDEKWAKKIVLHAEQEATTRGEPEGWDEADHADPLLGMYYECFFIDDDARDEMRDKVLQEFYEEVLPYDDSKYVVGAWLKSRGNKSMLDVFSDWTDVLYWPGGGFEGGSFNDDVAQRIAQDMEAAIGAEVAVTGEYHSGQRDDDTATRGEWNIEEDTSINVDNEEDMAAEIISPALEYEGGMEEIEKTIAFLNSIDAYTNDSTGLHINISLQGIDHENLDYVKLIVMSGDKYILNRFGRAMNQYAISAVTNLDNYLRDVGGSKYTAKQYAYFLGQMRTKIDKSLTRAFSGNEAINFGKYSSIGMKDNRIEFRAAGGEGYLDDWHEIEKTINRFIVAYAVAADPEAYKKEYAKKLYKLAQDAGTTGQASFTDEALKIFALHSAGALSKQELAQKLKALQDKRKANPESRDVDIERIEIDSMALRSAMGMLADVHSVSGPRVKEAMKLAVQWENEHNKDKYIKTALDFPKAKTNAQVRHDRAAEAMLDEILTNLVQNINHYGNTGAGPESAV